MASHSKNIVIAIIFFSVSIGISVYIPTRIQENLRDKLKTEGISRIAYITQIRRYFPPKGSTGYGEVLYKYQNVKGEILSGRSLLSKAQYEFLLNKSSLEILYHPDKTEKSMPVFLIIKEAMRGQ